MGRTRPFRTRSGQPLRRFAPPPHKWGGASVRRYDCSRDLVVDRLLLRVPQLPQPADRPDDADREPDFERPDEPTKDGVAKVRVLPGGLVAHLEAEYHHPDRLAPRAPEVAEVREVDSQVDDARQALNLLQDDADDAVDDEQDHDVD